MCGFFCVSRSGYYSYTERLNRPDPNQAIIERIASQQKRCKNTYGYRRMQLWLDKNGCHKNPKTILKRMKSHGLLSEIRNFSDSQSGAGYHSTCCKERKSRRGIAPLRRPRLSIYLTRIF
ncbi:IS3 family transposase [Subdoligranulum variabile]|uniref:IS3 family transposase n=1 Tax=Subdoligranulum variabile TaxID=214851 RepID=UPI000A05E1CE